MTVGIYRIINTVTNESYIGSSVDVEKRFEKHLKDLQNHTHHNIKLLEDFELYGESVFELEILKEYDTTPDREALYAEENEFISKYDAKNTGYNIADARFGDALTHHPDRVGRIQRIRKTLNANYSSMSQEERNLKYGHSGESNGRWKDSLHHNCIKCGKELKSYGSKHGNGCCTKCRDRTGANNPFFGKSHSADTIETLRSYAKLRVGANSPVAKRIYADGLIFDTMKECAEYFGKTPGTITHRVKSPNYPNFYYL